MSTQARAKSQEMRRAREAEAQRRKKRQRLFTGVGIAVILALVVAIVLVAVNAARGGDDAPSAGDGTSVAPSGATDDGGVLVGPEDAPVTMAVYYDYMCPACGAFEEANGAEVERLLEEGTAQLELRPISFLDDTSQGTRYSTRAANAFATVADLSPEHALDFHSALYAAQPEEGTTGLSDEEIAAVAEDAGVPGDVIEQFTEMRHEGWVAEVTDMAFDSGVSGTPTVLIDGEPFEGDLYQPGPLSAAVEAAAEQ